MPRPNEPVPADVAVRYLRELPKTWRQAKGGKGRQTLASAPFDPIDVLGMREAIVTLSAHAVRHGLAALLPAELRSPVYGRGERSSGHTFRLTYENVFAPGQAAAVELAIGRLN